ncbi:ELWxxDGT repeat protein [Marinoscillum furvescens]|uniref:Putative secreted protein (Por secretion system target) n=1 Tax=Marinoscillum furvescens DSM 4134 TaxID=1122208 RepID=A0A3D9L5E7_MARFU|nr:ELWxxDGT repeat protein [Marinoscillum furvescens]REE00170.1 putative secreted protein (Por secretion system target) [Marinoscillum furvescens DSM 4134]
MKHLFTFCLITLLALAESVAQEYENLQSISAEYGTLTALTSTADSVTSDGRRGGAKNYSGRQAISYGGKYYFTAHNDATGDELWVTDGTREGTKMVKDINPGAASSLPANLVGVGGSVYFTATTEAEGTELWVTDGTEAGTSLLIDLNEGAASSEPSAITPFKNGFLFAAVDASSSDYGDGKTRQHLWFSNGTPEGTKRMSADNKEGVQPKTTGLDGEETYSPIQVIGDTLAIFGGTSDRVVGMDGETELIVGEEIWVTNGTPEPWGTKMLVDINPPTDNSNIQWILAVNEKQVIFRAKTPGKWAGKPELTTLDNEYWVTDGTTKGTYLLQDAADAPGSEANTTANSGSANPIVFDGKVYYRGNAGKGTELMRMNGLKGTGDELEMAFDIAPFDTQERQSFPDDFFVFDGKLFFKVNFGSRAENTNPRSGQELGMYNPETDSVELVADVFPGAGTSSFPRNKTVVNGRMYFTANTGNNQSSYDIWALDVVGDGKDPQVPELDNLSKKSEYLIYKVFDDVDGFNRVLPTDLRELNGNLIFRTISGTLAVFDDGLEKTGEYQDPKAVGPAVEIGANAHLNAAPMASFTSPENGATLIEGATVPLAVALNDAEGDAISKVEYYTGDYYNSWVQVGVATEGEFTFNWENIPAGAEGEPTRITAVAYDANDSSFSMPIDVLVIGNTPPSVEMTLPNDNTTLLIGESVEIAATASDELDGLVVEFYNGDELLFKDEEAPFGFEWDGLTVEGTAVIKAVATDIQGASSESETRTVIYEKLVLSNELAKGMIVYPNPVTSGFVNISNDRNEVVMISLIDMAGRTVLQTELTEGVNSLPVQHLEKGIYSVSTRNVAGEILGHSKLIIK